MPRDARAYDRFGLPPQPDDCLTRARALYREMGMGFWLGQTEAALV